MSRSVRMPGPGASGSSTTAAPTWRSAIRRGRLAQRVPGPDRQHDAAHPVANLHLVAPPVRLQRLRDHTAQHQARTARSTDVSGCTRRSSSRELRVIHSDARRPYVSERAHATTSEPSATARSLFEDAPRSSKRSTPDLALDDIARRVASSRRQLQRAYAEIGHTTFREHLTARAHGARGRDARQRRADRARGRAAASATASPRSSPRRSAATTASSPSATAPRRRRAGTPVQRAARGRPTRRERRSASPLSRRVAPVRVGSRTGVSVSS